MQKITSAKTSLNQVPALHRWLVATQPFVGHTIVDYGGGRFNQAACYLMEKGAHIAITHDKYNRCDEHNSAVEKYWKNYSIDTVLCANVLNVIDDLDACRDVVFDCVAINSSAVKYFSTYEGNRSGIGHVTSKGYQRNEPTSLWVTRITEWLRHSHHVTRKGNNIVARPL